MPERFAHGYQALRDDTDTTYCVGEFYAPAAEGGLMHDDPQLGLQWPLPISVISEKDLVFPPLREIEADLKRMMSLHLWMRDGTSPPTSLSCKLNPRRRSKTMWIVDTELKAREEQNGLSGSASSAPASWAKA